MTFAPAALLVLPLLGVPLPEERSLVPGDASPGQAFGTSVALDAGVALVGAYADDELGVLSGAAYLFVTATGAQRAKLLASNGTAGDRYGTAVALSGALALVGAPDRGPGAAYVTDPADGTELRILSGPGGAAGDGFGAAVALDGTLALVGAPGRDTLGADAGAAYLVDATTGTVLHELLASDGAAGARFGAAVAVAGAFALVGAPESSVGAAYVFDVATGAELAKLVPGGLAPGARFGAAVALDGGTALVGAPLDDVAGADSGAAFLLSLPFGATVLPLVPGDAAPGAELGTSVALRAGVALVGARRDGEAGALAGAAYAFDAGSGAEVAKLVASSAARLDELGVSVALDASGTEALVGAWMADPAGPFSGAAYLFPTAPEPGTPFCDASDGALAACPCGNAGAPDTGCDLQQGTGGVRLVAVRQETAPDNRMTWNGTGFPGGTSPASVVLRAATLETAPTVFGDGLRCVGVPLTRLAATFVSTATAVHTHGHGAMAGSGTFHYQLWFRNTPAMFCTPDAFNLSSGRSLVW